MPSIEYMTGIRRLMAIPLDDSSILNNKTELNFYCRGLSANGKEKAAPYEGQLVGILDNRDDLTVGKKNVGLYILQNRKGGTGSADNPYFDALEIILSEDIYDRFVRYQATGEIQTINGSIKITENLDIDENLSVGKSITSPEVNTTDLWVGDWNLSEDTENHSLVFTHLPIDKPRANGLTPNGTDTLYADSTTMLDIGDE